MNLAGGIALFVLLAVVIYFIWRWWGRSLYASLFGNGGTDVGHVTPEQNSEAIAYATRPSDGRRIIPPPGEVPFFYMMNNLEKGEYPKSAYKLGRPSLYPTHEHVRKLYEQQPQ
jgi:hypothetical protein